MDVRNEASSLLVIVNSHLFKSLDEEGRLRLMQQAATVTYDTGHIIVKEGDPGDALYLLKQGKVDVYTTRQGERVFLSNLGPGACFGEVALLSGRPRSATVVAVERCSLLCFYKSQIEELLCDYPKVRKLLESVVIGRARNTIEILTKVPTGER